MFFKLVWKSILMTSRKVKNVSLIALNELLNYWHAEQIKRRETNRSGLFERRSICIWPGETAVEELPHPRKRRHGLRRFYAGALESPPLPLGNSSRPQKLPDLVHDCKLRVNVFWAYPVVLQRPLLDFDELLAEEKCPHLWSSWPPIFQGRPDKLLWSSPSKKR